MKTLYTGEHLRLVERRGWEFADRRSVTGIVAIVAVTEDQELLLVEQWREPVSARVIELPAGLAGDEPGREDEAIEEAARRELVEETGYRAERFEMLTAGPPSPGFGTEVIHFLRAVNIRRVGEGGGEGGEEITVHSVPLSGVDTWLEQRSGHERMVDPKVYAGLYFLL